MNPETLVSFLAINGAFFGFFVVIMACAMPETFLKPVHTIVLGIKMLIGR